MFFIGTGRSGHSIVGSLMDAHPHAIITHEYGVFTKWKEFYNPNQNWTGRLFRILIDKSRYSVSGSRNMSNKGYTLTVDNLWQGKFNNTLEVLGDQYGEGICILYLKNKTLFQTRLEILKKNNFQFVSFM